MSAPLPAPSQPRLYLDHNATSPLRPEARAAMIEALDHVGNPSSIHAEGRAARALVEDARRAVAELLGVPARSVIFTSGGTEAANLALTPDIAAPGRPAALARLLAGAGEHPCVLSGHRFAAAQAATAPLTPDGRLDLAALAERLDAAPEAPALLALQAANNETGVIQPVAQAAALVKARGGLVVCDAAQATGRIALAAATQGADIALLSAHKFGGPQGVGACVLLTPGLTLRAPLIRGGGQERGARGGTENVAAIAGFGAAARAALAALEQETPRLLALRRELERALLAAAPDATIFGGEAERLPNTVCFAIPGVAASALLMRLDLAGVAASSGSACSSGKVARSHVLAAMGVPDALATGAIRLSLGWSSGAADVAGFAEQFGPALAPLRRARGAA